MEIREKLSKLFVCSLISLFFVCYLIYFSSFKIVFAATPFPASPSVSDSPDPQQGGSAVTFSSNYQPGLSGETVKLYICKDSSCTNCGITKTDAPSNPSFSSSSANVVEVNSADTIDEDNGWGYIQVTDTSTTTAEEGNWTWDFGSSAYGTYYIKWYGNVTGVASGACVGITLQVMASNDGATWSLIRTATLSGQYGTGTYWTGQVYLDSVTGTYRFMRARIYSNTTCQVNKGYLSVDGVKRSVETATNCWCNSSFVASNPSCSYTLPSCCSGITVGANNYWSMSCAWQTIPNISACKVGPSSTFTCKKENLCVCSAGECYNECKNDPDGSGAWCCNANQCSHDGNCYTLVELTSSGASACILGENIAHNTQGITNYRYATYDGQLYYCGASNTDKDAYAQTTDLIPNDKIGLCQCRWDGTWNCGGIVVIRGGRIIKLPT